MTGRLTRAALLGALMLVATATPGMCGGEQSSVKVVKIFVYVSSGVAQIQTNGGAATGAPSCASSSWQFGYNASNASSSTATALLISAVVTGTTVRLDGAGTCNTISGSEDLSDVYYND